jgi:hypothetical protein
MTLAYLLSVRYEEFYLDIFNVMNLFNFFTIRTKKQEYFSLVCYLRIRPELTRVEHILDAPLWVLSWSYPKK